MNTAARAAGRGTSSVDALHQHQYALAMSENSLTPLALDESLYDLTEDGRTFFKQQTGIPDDDELKAHIFRVQAEAYEVRIHELWNLIIAAWKRNS